MAFGLSGLRWVSETDGDIGNDPPADSDSEKLEYYCVP